RNSATSQSRSARFAARVPCDGSCSRPRSCSKARAGTPPITARRPARPAATARARKLTRATRLQRPKLRLPRAKAKPSRPRKRPKRPRAKISPALKTKKPVSLTGFFDCYGLELKSAGCLNDLLVVVLHQAEQLALQRLPLFGLQDLSHRLEGLGRAA